jgi:hypothetical protein
LFVYVAAAAQQRKRDKHAREVHALHAGSLTAGADAAGTSVEAHVGRATRDKHDAMEDASYGLMSGSLDTHPLRQLRAYAPGLFQSHHVLLSFCRYVSTARLHAGLRGLPEIGDAGVTAIASMAPRLTSLDLSRTRISDKPLAIIARRCTQLRSLRLDGCIGMLALRVALRLATTPPL